jgi:hypothetical protein
VRETCIALLESLIDRSIEYTHIRIADSKTNMPIHLQQTTHDPIAVRRSVWHPDEAVANERKLVVAMDEANQVKEERKRAAEAKRRARLAAEAAEAASLTAEARLVGIYNITYITYIL